MQVGAEILLNVPKPGMTLTSVAPSKTSWKSEVDRDQELLPLE